MSTPSAFDDDAPATEGQEELQMREESPNPNNVTNIPDEEIQEVTLNPRSTSISFKLEDDEEFVPEKDGVNDVKEDLNDPFPMFGDIPQNSYRSSVLLSQQLAPNESSYETPKYLLDAHRNMMQAALYDAGNFCYGVKRIEIWIFDPETNRLKMPSAGSWTDPVYQINDNIDLMRSLRKIHNPPEELSYAPGEGLPGILWTESNWKKMATYRMKLDASTMTNIARFNAIQWRDVKALADDPDQPYNPRLRTIADAGFRLAAGVPFNIRGTQGVVIYMARDSVNRTKLKNRLNEEYILASAGHIASVQSLRKPRRLATEYRRSEIKKIFRKFKRILPLLKDYGKEHALNNAKKDPQSPPNTEKSEIKPETTCTENVEATLHKTKEKVVDLLKLWEVRMHGGDILPPPGMATNTSIFVVFAAFLTCFIMACISTAVKKSTPERFGSPVGFEMGQIAGAATMVFTLTAAPAAQPRSIILGRLLSLIVGLIFNLIPINSTGDPYDDPLGWVRFAGAVAVSSALMAKLGIAHPPGGSLANTFAFKFSFEKAITYQKIGVLLLQDSIFVVLASAINNFGDTKPYPTYWGYIPNMFSRFIRSFFEDKDKVQGKEA